MISVVNSRNRFAWERSEISAKKRVSMAPIMTACLAALLLLPRAALAMPDYLKQIPNGDLFASGKLEGKWLGHPEGSEALRTPLADAFKAAKYSYNKDVCGTKWEGADMTIGEALGDPCCTWKIGDKAMPITPWTEGEQPKEKTVCDNEPKDGGGDTGGGGGGGEGGESDAGGGGGGDDGDDGDGGDGGRGRVKIIKAPSFLKDLGEDEEEVVVFFKARKRKLHCRLRKRDSDD